MRILVGAILLLNVCLLKAEMSVARYRENVASGELGRGMAQSYVLGLGEGIRVTNVTIGLRGKRLFCPPTKLALGVENFVDILGRSIKDASVRMSKAKLDEQDISVLLLQGIIDAFPCTAK